MRSSGLILTKEEDQRSNVSEVIFIDKGGGTMEDISKKLDALNTRVTSIEATLPHLATNAWILGGIIGGMATAAMIGLLFARLVT